MSNVFNAFEISPVPAPGPDVQPPGQFRGIYGMPMFVTVPCTDLEASTRFWIERLGFFDLFSVPGRLVHLRRWAFQDVLLVPATGAPEQPAGRRPPLVSFACVLSELEPLAANLPDAATAVVGPHDTAWNTRDLELTTPEGVRVVFTAAKAWDPTSAEATNLTSIGITPPTDPTATTQ